jgi:hypothetical protein
MTEFHKIWIEQCEAAEEIKERFGAQDAARYLIAEKLLRFMDASHDHPKFAAELPKFVAEIKRIIEPHEIVALFDDLQTGQVPDPTKIFNGRDADDDQLDENEVLYDANKILLIENAKALLLPKSS